MTTKINCSVLKLLRLADCLAQREHTPRNGPNRGTTIGMKLSLVFSSTASAKSFSTSATLNRAASTAQKSARKEHWRPGHHRYPTRRSQVLPLVIRFAARDCISGTVRSGLLCMRKPCLYSDISFLLQSNHSWTDTEKFSFAETWRSRDEFSDVPRLGLRDWPKNGRTPQLAFGGHLHLSGAWAIPKCSGTSPMLSMMP